MIDKKERQVFSPGNAILRFEKAFAKYTGTRHAILTNSGISALNLVLSAIDIDKKNEIITQAYVCKDVPRILSKYAKVVFGDLDSYYTLDPEDLRNKITGDSSVVVPVHLYGQPAAMKEIKEIALENDLFLIEDCAHSLGAEYNGKKVGSIGDAGIFSLRKNMAVNSGGVITLNDDELASRIRELRERTETGYNYLFHLFYFLNMAITSIMPRRIVPYIYFLPYEVSKLKKDRIHERITNTEASVSLTQLDKVDGFIEKTRKNASYLNERLREYITVPEERENTKHVYTKYAAVFNKDIDMKRTLEEFRKNGFETGMTYVDEYYKNMRSENIKLPGTDKIAGKLVALSIPSSYNKDELDPMIELIRKI